MNVVGVGVDIVDVARMERILARSPEFVGRVFSDAEIAYCDGRSRRAACYAARWAAREACAKALGGIDRGRWNEMRVVRHDGGSVSLELDGSARARARDLGVERVLVSFSHDGGSAIAYCVAVGGAES